MRLVALLAVALLPLLGATACGEAERTAPGRAATPFDAALHDALPADVRERGLLRIATDASYAPASSFAEDGRTIVGFEPDLGAALGRVLGVEVRFEQTGFSRLLPRLARGRTDLVMSAMTDTPERERRADFVNYFMAGTAIIVQRGNPHGVTELGRLCNHVVAVERGTVQVDLLKRSQRHCGDEPILIRTYDTNADALVQLRTGRATAVLTDYPPAAHLATDRRTRARFQLASTAQYEPGPYGIAVAKHRPDLRDAVRAALSRLIASREYADVLARWGVGDGAVDESAINAGGNG